MIQCNNTGITSELQCYESSLPQRQVRRFGRLDIVDRLVFVAFFTIDPKVNLSFNLIIVKFCRLVNLHLRQKRRNLRAAEAFYNLTEHSVKQLPLTYCIYQYFYKSWTTQIIFASELSCNCRLAKLLANVTSQLLKSSQGHRLRAFLIQPYDGTFEH